MPLCIDLFCGLGGWAEGFLAEGWDVIGFDIDRHDYGTGGYPGQLVLQDILTLHGSQLRHADVIVASPPCQKYSYMAMPWKRAKELATWYRAETARIGELNALFDACFRIQREASEAAGNYIPMVVENVKGAQPWVGRARWHYGSYYLWGDVPALMPFAGGTRKAPMNFHEYEKTGQPSRSFQSVSVEHTGVKVPGLNWSGSDKPGYVARAFNDTAVKNNGGSWFNQAHNTESGVGQNPDGRKLPHGSGEAVKVSGDWFGQYAEQKEAGTISPGRLYGKHSQARRAASAAIAKIPFELARHIAVVYKP